MHTVKWCAEETDFFIIGSDICHPVGGEGGGEGGVGDIFLARLENHDIPFCRCFPAGGLDFEKYVLCIYLRIKTLLFAWIRASGVC